MLDRATQWLEHLPEEEQRRVALLEADGENAEEAVGGRHFAAVMCRGVLGVEGRADRVEELSILLASQDVEPVCW